MSHACCIQTSGSTSQRIALPGVGDREQAIAVGREARRHRASPAGPEAASRSAAGSRRPRARPCRRRARWPGCGRPGRTPAPESRPPPRASGCPTRRQPSVAQTSAPPSTLAAGEQAAVGGEGDRADLAVGAQPGEPLAAAGSRTSTPSGSRLAPEEPNGIASCEPSGLNANPSTAGPRCSGRPTSFASSRSQIRTAPPSRPRRAGPPTEGERPDVRGVVPLGADRGAQERADALPRPGVPEADAATCSGDRQPAPVGRVLDRERRPAGEGLEAAGPAQRLGVDQVHPAVLPRDRERAAVGAEGERRGALARLVEGVGAERPSEPAVAGHVPDDHARVVAGRVEGAPVGAEGLAPHDATVALESLDRASLPHVPDDHLPAVRRRWTSVRPSGLKAPTQNARIVASVQRPHPPGGEVEQANASVLALEGERVRRRG